MAQFTFTGCDPKPSTTADKSTTLILEPAEEDACCSWDPTKSSIIDVEVKAIEFEYNGLGAPTGIKSIKTLSRTKLYFEGPNPAYDVPTFMYDELITNPTSLSSIQVPSTGMYEFIVNINQNTCSECCVSCNGELGCPQFTSDVTKDASKDEPIVQVKFLECKSSPCKEAGTH